GPLFSMKTSAREQRAQCFHDRIPGSSPNFDTEWKVPDPVAAALDPIRHRRIFDEVGRKSTELAKEARAAREEPAASKTKKGEGSRPRSVVGAHEVKIAALEHLASR